MRLGKRRRGWVHEAVLGVGERRERSSPPQGLEPVKGGTLLKARSHPGPACPVVSGHRVPQRGELARSPLHGAESGSWGLFPFGPSHCQCNLNLCTPHSPRVPQARGIKMPGATSTAKGVLPSRPGAGPRHVFTTLF